MLNLFIDTNIFLNFYHFSQEDIEELKKLTAAIDAKEVSLLITTQVKDEFWRNRENKIHDALQQFNNFKFVPAPTICKQYAKDYDSLREAQRNFENLRKKITDRINEEIDSISLPPDALVRTLFEKGRLINTSSVELVENAKCRYYCGNPPGKGDSLGDAINWEALLNSEIAGDLCFISNDKDYASVTDPEKFSLFLAQEWREKKSSNVYLYRGLSTFFKNKYPNIKLAEDLGKDLAIRNLAESPSYAYTHTVIEYLARFPEFNKTEVERILQAAIENTQVHQIITDTDLESFFDWLLSKFSTDVDPTILNQFRDCRQRKIALQQQQADFLKSLLGDISA